MENNYEEFDELLETHKLLYDKLYKYDDNNSNIFIIFENNFLDIKISIRNKNFDKYKNIFEICYSQYLEMKNIYSRDNYNILLDNSHTYNTERLIIEGTVYQDKIIQSLETDLSNIKKSKEIHIDTIIELDKQYNQLISTYDVSNNVNSTLISAKKRLAILARNIYKDWIIKILCLLVLMALIVVVILLFIKKLK
jgi:hypothetical protein